MLTYNTGQPSLLVSNPNQPVYTIAYRANNGGSVLASNLFTGPAAATYVTAARNPMNTEMRSIQSDSDQDENNYRTVPKVQRFKKVRYLPAKSLTVRKARCFI